jgi:hypothetical protein
MCTKGITFHVSRADSRHYLPEVIDLVATGGLRPLQVPSTIIGWDDAAKARMEPATKLIIDRTR